MVETAAEGWWYTAPLPGSAMIGMLMTDADLCRRHALAGNTNWQARLRSAPCTAARMRMAPPSTLPRVHPAASHRLLRADDPRPWLAVGDAALAVDPLSGSGVPRALRTAETATRTVSQLLDRPSDAAADEAREKVAPRLACGPEPGVRACLTRVQ